MIQNGWIIAGVLALGWSASVVVGGIYLETLFCTMALRHAVLRSGRADVKTGGLTYQGGEVRVDTLADSTWMTRLVGLSQGAFVALFGLAAFRDAFDPIWRFSINELGQVVAGAAITAVIEYRRLREQIPEADDDWLRSRADLQFSTTIAQILCMMVLPWSFFVVGERGLFVALIGAKAAIDIRLASR